MYVVSERRIRREKLRRKFGTASMRRRGESRLLFRRTRRNPKTGKNEILHATRGWKRA